jgi:hypothetical protein
MVSILKNNHLKGNFCSIFRAIFQNFKSTDPEIIDKPFVQRNLGLKKKKIEQKFVLFDL